MACGGDAAAVAGLGADPDGGCACDGGDAAMVDAIGVPKRNSSDAAEDTAGVGGAARVVVGDAVWLAAVVSLDG